MDDREARFGGSPWFRRRIFFSSRTLAVQPGKAEDYVVSNHLAQVIS
jgi:hypothetical protein